MLGIFSSQSITFFCVCDIIEIILFMSAGSLAKIIVGVWRKFSYPSTKLFLVDWYST